MFGHLDSLRPFRRSPGTCRPEPIRAARPAASMPTANLPTTQESYGSVPGLLWPASRRLASAAAFHASSYPHLRSGFTGCTRFLVELTGPLEVRQEPSARGGE